MSKQDTFVVRIPGGLYGLLSALAEKKYQNSVTAFIIAVLAEYVEKEKAASVKAALKLARLKQAATPKAPRLSPKAKEAVKLIKNVLELRRQQGILRDGAFAGYCRALEVWTADGNGDAIIEMWESQPWLEQGFSMEEALDDNSKLS